VILGRLFARWRSTPPPCQACVHFRLIGLASPICEAGDHPRFADTFRDRPAAFGGCGVGGRFFKSRGKQ